MSETADANNLLAIIVLSYWWALLSVLGVLSRRGGSEHAPEIHEAPTAGEDQDFPELRNADAEFSSAAFLLGACRAYEEILGAYARCDAKALHALLSAEVLYAFTDAFEARAAREETLELTFIGIRSAAIVGVDVRPDAMEIVVRFSAQVIQSERSARGEVIRGDPGTVAVVDDLWTFSRSRPIDTVSWIVIATDEYLETG